MPIVTEVYEIRCHMIEQMAVEPAVAHGGSVQHDPNKEGTPSSFELIAVDNCATFSHNSRKTNDQERPDDKQVLDIIDISEHISEHIIESNRRSISSGAVTAYVDSELYGVKLVDGANSSLASPRTRRQLNQTQA
jgi:CCR4-NOT transcriptional regulation complex NOT5 subunit